jgi:hypothetical protein
MDKPRPRKKQIRAHTVSLRVDDALAIRLNKIAENENRTISNLLHILVREALTARDLREQANGDRPDKF